MSKCLVCFGELATGDYHPACARKLFDNRRPLSVEFGVADLEREGLNLLRQKGGVAGVQTKLSLGRDADQPHRLTILGYQGRFLLKPPSAEYPGLPENEAFCMELASRLGLPAAPHGLVRMADGALAYLSRRFDRPSETERWHQEDFCQLAERPSADKYKGSLEAAGKLLRYSRQPGLDAVRFLELSLFCWLTGNADMHLKNFSLLHNPAVGWTLSPAYDLVSTRLALPDDQEETSLPVNGKKARLTRQDWVTLSSSLGVPEKVLHGLVKRLSAQTPTVESLVTNSLLGEDGQVSFLEVWRTRAALLSS